MFKIQVILVSYTVNNGLITLDVNIGCLNVGSGCESWRGLGTARSASMQCWSLYLISIDCGPQNELNAPARGVAALSVCTRTPRRRRRLRDNDADASHRYSHSHLLFHHWCTRRSSSPEGSWTARMTSLRGSTALTLDMDGTGTQTLCTMTQYVRRRGSRWLIIPYWSARGGCGARLGQTLPGRAPAGAGRGPQPALHKHGLSLLTPIMSNANFP